MLYTFPLIYILSQRVGILVEAVLPTLSVLYLPLINDLVHQKPKYPLPPCKASPNILKRYIHLPCRFPEAAHVFQEQIEHFELIRADWDMEKQALEEVVVRMREQLKEKDVELQSLTAQKVSIIVFEDGGDLKPISFNC